MPGHSIHDPILCESQDTLERRYLAERIFDRLVSESCPEVIGIYGGWGTGKTSLLNLIQERWQKSNEQTIQIEHFDRKDSVVAREIHGAVNSLRQVGLL